MTHGKTSPCVACGNPCHGRGGSLIGYPADGEPKLPSKRLRLCSTCWADVVTLVSPSDRIETECQERTV